MAKREAFNFYRSYYDVFKELPHKDKLDYIEALLDRQFTGIETELTGMAKFAYISQKHSIDRQIKGWEDKTKETLIHPPAEGGFDTPTKQEKEKEKEKEKEQEQEEFTPPTHAEVEAHITLKFKELYPNHLIDHEKLNLFLDDYLETNNLKGWKTNQNRRITVWRSNCNLWVKNNGGYEHFKKVVKNRSFQ